MLSLLLLLTLLPNGRTITPEGNWIETAPFPFALALRPDGRQMVVPSIGFPFSLNIIDGLGTKHPGEHPTVRRIPEGHQNDPAVQVHTGVAYSPDGRLLYDATGDSGAVDVLDTGTWHSARRIDLNGESAGEVYRDSFAASLMLSHDGRYLYVIDQGNWRVVVIDTAGGRKIASLPAGVNPIALCLSADGARLHIVNSGLFEYKLVGGVERNRPLKTGLKFPPFGYPSRQARVGVHAEGHSVPGLGDPNSSEGSSLWTYDVADLPRSPRLVAQLRLGSRVGGRVIGGASPSAVAASASHVYVALAHDDAVGVISADGRALETQIPLTPFTGTAFVDRKGTPLRGIMPSGLALFGDRLYVTEAGLNAVAVIDTATNRVIEHRPTGWNPSAVALSRDGTTLYVVNAKGKGSGPNAGLNFHAKANGSYIGDLEFGSVSVLQTNADASPEESTARVVRNNEAALTPGTPLPRLRHVFFIIRENRTFDEILGDAGGVNGDPSVARYGVHGWVEENRTLKDLRVTPNAHSLLARFAGSDNFYADSDVSADGHRWAVGIAPTPWMNIAWASNYGGRRTGDAFSNAPGRRAFTGGADGPMPEDEPEFGSLWEHVAQARLPLLNYGEGLELEGSDETDGAAPEGQRLFLNSPLPRPVWQSTDRRFPTFNLGIPDQFRFAEFRNDFARRLKNRRVPALTVIRLPGDHTADTRPRDGYPFRASYVADNDLALGKIVHFLSSAGIWKDSAIFVIEDDAQSGVDHVDAHRSVLLVISPYARRGYVSHRHTSFPSVQKTIYELLGLGPLNLEDALAADLSDMFTRRPDLTPFPVQPADDRVFDPKRARLAHPKTKAEAAALLDCDDPWKIRSLSR